MNARRTESHRFIAGWRYKTVANAYTIFAAAMNRHDLRKDYIPSVFWNPIWAETLVKRPHYDQHTHAAFSVTTIVTIALLAVGLATQQKPKNKGKECTKEPDTWRKKLLSGYRDAHFPENLCGIRISFYPETDRFLYSHSLMLPHDVSFIHLTVC